MVGVKPPPTWRPTHSYDRPPPDLNPPPYEPQPRPGHLLPLPGCVGVLAARRHCQTGQRRLCAHPSGVYSLLRFGADFVVAGAARGGVARYFCLAFGRAFGARGHHARGVYGLLHGVSGAAAGRRGGAVFHRAAVCYCAGRAVFGRALGLACLGCRAAGFCRGDGDAAAWHRSV